MTAETSSSYRPSPRLRSVLSIGAVAVLLGGAVIAPMTMPGAQANIQPPVLDEERLYQEFVPNVDPLDDLILDEVPLEKLPDPKPEPTPEPEAAAAQSAPAEAPRYTGGGSPAEWMAAAGIPESDWGFVDYIVRHESTWNPNAINPAGGYCGLVQIAPLHGVDNCTDPVVNLTWGNSYALGRYGSWEAAYNFGVIPGGGWRGW